MTEAQIAEKEAVKEMTYNQRGIPKSQLASKGALTNGNDLSGPPKFKTRGQLFDREIKEQRSLEELGEYEHEIDEEGGPMSLTIETRGLAEENRIQEDDDFEQ